MAADWKCNLKVEVAVLKVLPRPECSLTSLNPRVDPKITTWPHDIPRPSTTAAATPVSHSPMLHIPAPEESYPGGILCNNFIMGEREHKIGT